MKIKNSWKKKEKETPRKNEASFSSSSSSSCSNDYNSTTNCLFLENEKIVFSHPDSIEPLIVYGLR